MSGPIKVLYGDFNNFDQHRRLLLSCPGSRRSIESLAEPLEEGEVVMISDGELQTLARVHHADDGVWEAYGEWLFEDAPPKER